MKFIYLQASFLLALFAVCLQNATAQTLVAVHQYKNIIQRADLVGTPLGSTQSEYVFRQLLHIPSSVSLVQYHTETDTDGNTHSRYQQYYKGILVEGGEYILHSNKQGTLYAVNGTYLPIVDFAVEQKLNSTAAIQAAMQAIGAKEYAWQNLTTEKLFKQLKKDEKATYFPNPLLSIVATKEKDTTTYQLGYTMYIRATNPDIAMQVTIDAQTGKLLRTVNSSCQVNNTANTLYNGNNVPLKTSLAPNTTDEYILHDQDNNIRTLNGGGGTLPSGTEYSNYGTNNWWAAKPEHDAHFGATKTVEYWKNTHFRNSYDGSYNTELVQLANAKSFVKINGVLVPTHDNASWSQAEKVVRYGNGGTTFKPTTSLDFVAHEIGHAYSFGLRLGYLSNNTLVTDEYAEVWDLHEGFSDIWAMCVDRDDWTMGEQVMKENFGCLRSIEKPNIVGNASLKKGMDTYKIPQKITDFFNTSSYSDPHTRGLLLAHWFYILCEGKTGINEVNNFYSVQGLGREYAEKIAYRMYNHLPYNAQWKDIAPAALAAAKEMHGECSVQYATVHNALYAVNLLTVGGLPNLPKTVPTVSYTAPSTLLCHTEETTAAITYGYTPASQVTYEWRILDEGRGLFFTDGNGADWGTNSGGNAVRLKFIEIGGGDLTVNYYARVQVIAYCGATPAERKVVATQTFFIWLGRPNPIKVLQPNFTELCVGRIYGVQVQGGEGRTETVWVNETPNVLQKVSEEYHAAFYRIIGYGTAKVSVAAKNRCFAGGVPAPFSAPVLYECLPDDRPCPPRVICPSPLRFVLAPNPASSTVRIKNSNQQENQTTNFVWRIYNPLGILLKNEEATNEAIIDVTQWADGIYTVLVETEQGVQPLKLVVQKGVVAN